MKQELTDKWLMKYDSKGERVEIWDTLFPDLYVRVSATNTKTFWLRYYDGNGDRKRKPLGEFPDELTVSMARDMVRNHKVDEGLPEAKRPKGGKATWLTLYDKFVATRTRRGDMSKRTLEAWQQLVEKEVNPYLGQLDPEESKVFRQAVRAILDRLENRGVPVLRNRVFTIIRTIYNWSISEDVIEPGTALLGIKELNETPRQRILSEEEIRKVLAVAGVDQPEWRAFWALLFRTAARRGAILEAKWEQFDFKEKVWIAPGAIIKGKKGEKDTIRYIVIPLSEGLIKVLKVAKEITGHTPYVVANLATGLAQTNPQKAFIRMNKKAALKERWTRHDIRHTISTNLGRLRTEPHIIDRIMHHIHGLTNIHSRYNQWEYIDQKREALDAWGAYLDGLIKKSA